MQDVLERDEEKQLMRQYTRPHTTADGHAHSNANSGFVVRDAPWSGPLVDEFPTLGAKNSGVNPPVETAPPVVTSPQKSSWGGKQKPKWGPSVLGPKIPPK